MESVSVLEMYEHSERLFNICYRLFIGDEGSSSYGTMIVIEKSEYTNHTRQRGWGSQLQKFLQNYKGSLRITQKFNLSMKKMRDYK